MGNTAAVVNEAGELYNVSAAEAEQAMAAGQVRAATSDEFEAHQAQEAEKAFQGKYGGAGGVLANTALTALDTATFGMANPAIATGAQVFGGDQAGRDFVEYQKNVSAANPLSGLAGTALGVLAPGGIAKGAGLLAKGGGALSGAARLVEGGATALGAPMRGLTSLGTAAERGITSGLGQYGKSALGQLLAKGVGVGAEAGIIGGTSELGKQLTEEAIGNHALNAQRIVAAAGHDFVLGSLLGGGLAGAAMLGKSAPGVVGSLFRRGGEEGAALEGASLSTRLEDTANEMALKSIGRDKKLVMNMEKTAQGGSKGVSAIWREEVPKVLEKEHWGQVTQEELPQAAELMKDKWIAKRSEALSKMDTASEKLNLKLNAQDVLGDLRGAVQGLENKMGTQTQRAKIQEEIDWLSQKWGVTDSTGKIVNQDATITMRELADRRVDADALMKKSFKDISLDSHYLVRDALEKRLTDHADQVSSAVGESLSADYRQSKKMLQAAKFLETGAAGGTAATLTNQPRGLTDKIFGAAGANVASTLGGGLLGSVAGGFITQEASNFLRRRMPFQGAELASRASKLLKVVQSSAEMGSVVQRRIADVTSPAQTARALVREVPADMEYFGRTQKERSENVGATIARMNDAGALVNRLGDKLAPLNAEAPKTAAAISSQMANVAAFLASKAPKATNSAVSVAPWLDKPKYPDHQVRIFARYMKAAANPLSVFDDLEGGRLHAETVETVKSIYPDLYTDMRQQFARTLSDPSKAQNLAKLPLTQRIQIASFFAIPYTLTDPSYIRDVQSSMAPQQPNQGQPPVSPAPSRGPSVMSDLVDTDSDHRVE